ARRATSRFCCSGSRMLNSSIARLIASASVAAYTWSMYLAGVPVILLMLHATSRGAGAALRWGRRRRRAPDDYRPRRNQQLELLLSDNFDFINSIACIGSGLLFRSSQIPLIFSVVSSPINICPLRDFKKTVVRLPTPDAVSEENFASSTL